MKARLLLSVALIALAGPALAQPFMSVETSGGKVLADEKGMTLYTFDNDKKGESSCYDACAANWPPYLAASSATAEGAYSLVTRKDGKKQWALNGMPLYLFVKDMKQGDMTGDGVKGIWHAARP
ncbi:hypothetical protein J5N58_01530 [Rhizobium cremeum]|uniref:COG4315 family predicted lipoprotein n=1 Tax=Rhizobium cremeum TaxID=2813827 RepID=UPI000DD717FF|nr:hypothetical protein [Rhizobium cremeum]MCJ7993278.1 hypothetical protein [Rhizobium cremeum]MCJ7998343.1 hypothetical protein [Rhizobium cremeum]